MLIEHEGVGPGGDDGASGAPLLGELRPPPRRSRPANIGAVTLIAHAGHWLTTIAYFVPVVVFLGWLVVTQVRDRRGRSGP